MDQTAAGLLEWFDKHHERSVIETVMDQLQGGAGLEAGALHTTAAAVPVCLKLDVTALASVNPMLAMEVMSNTGHLELQATTMINQQLASMQTRTEATDELAEEPPSVRVCLQMQEVPLPLLSVPEVVQAVVNSTTASSSSGGDKGIQQQCVSLLAVLTGISSPAEVCHSQRFHCPSCGHLTDVPASHTTLPCCCIPKTEWLKEDITGRVMVQTQQVWASELSAATGRSSYGVSSPALQLHLPEHLVSSTSLGQAVHIIGHASTAAVCSSQSNNCIQVRVNNLQPVLPHVTWLLDPAASAHVSELHQQPLQSMWDLLTAALGYHTPLDPHLSMALLLSAAAVGSCNKRPGSHKVGQVNVLVLHEAFNPTPRLLREAAALLSPHSVAMPVQQAEHIIPITGGTGPEQMSKAVFASTLHLANTGIVAADLALMASKSKKQLLQALQQCQTPVPKDLPQAVLIPPVSATCWAAVSWEEGCPVESQPGRRGSHSKDRTTYHGFDLCIGNNTVHEDDLWGLLDIQSSTIAAQFELQQSQLKASSCLHHWLATAVSCEQPVLSEAAQAFLGQYFLMVRQSVDGTSYVSKPHLLASVMHVASAAARLHKRSAVLEFPDAALAVVLMEHTLTNKLGEAYHSLLDLPCDLNPSNGRSLDEQVQLLHGVISRAFQQSGLSLYDIDDGGEGGAVGQDDEEDSYVSGCAGGAFWDKKGPFEGPEE